MADRYSRLRHADEPRLPVVTVPRRRRNIGSRFCHVILILPFLFAIALTILSFTSLYTKRNAASGGCPLYAKYDDSRIGSDKFQPGPRSSCMLSMWGEIAVAGLCVLAVLWLVFMAVAGYKILSMFTIVEMLLFLILFIGSATISANISVGLAMTCKSVETNSAKCDTEGAIPYDILYQASIASWVAGGVLLITVFIWMFLAILACCVSCLSNNNHNEGAPLINRQVRSRENAFQDSDSVHERPPSYDRHDNCDSSSLSSKASFN